MERIYLMQRFDISENYPKKNFRRIELYIDSSFVLIDEGGVMIPLGVKGWGNVSGLSDRVIEGLRVLQDRGIEINGGVHPLYIDPIHIEVDMEFYKSFPKDSADFHRLLDRGVNLFYVDAA